MTVENEVARHYGGRNLEETVVRILGDRGLDIDHLTTDDLGGADEFHMGGTAATMLLAQSLKQSQALTPGSHLLDVGSGVGGPARRFAETLGCRVTGIDLTPDFVEAAISFTRRCGLSARVDFKTASALSLPFSNAAFDGATLIHVGMNIADKAGLCIEIRRVLKPGAIFIAYEEMRTGLDDIRYPMPWASTAAVSSVETPDAYRQLMQQAGFDILAMHDHRDLVLRIAAEAREAARRDGPAALGPALVMGPQAKEMFGNLVQAIQQGQLAPIELIARAQ